MPDIQFNDNMPQRYGVRGTPFQENNTGMIGFLVKHGIVKNDTQAYYILIAIAIVCFGCAIALPLIFSPSNSTVPPTSIQVKP
jgi:hypothetical protein